MTKIECLQQISLQLVGRKEFDKNRQTVRQTETVILINRKAERQKERKTKRHRQTDSKTTAIVSCYLR